MDIIQTLNKWMEYTNFKPNSIAFTLVSDNKGYNSWTLDKINNTVISIIENYDDSGLLSLLYLKPIIKKHFGSLSINLIDILNNNYDINIPTQIWNEINDPQIIQQEDLYISNINQFVDKIINKPLIGDYDNDQLKESFFVGLNVVLDNIEKLNLDVYIKGGPVLPINNISTHIHVFELLSDCLLALENTKDGMYLCFINNHGSSDSYFGYYVKSNGNIFCLNERIDEKYIGQHKNMRNGRWAESKQYDLFPYNYIFDYTNHDYKGYATKHIIDQDKLNFFELGSEVYNTIILAMVLINKKYTNKTLDSNVKLVNSLLDVNIKPLLIDDKSDITLYQNSQLVKSHKEIDLTFDNDKVINGEYDTFYNFKSKDYQVLVDMFGKDFRYNPILITDITKLLTDGKTLEDQNINCEFIGDIDRIRKQGYFEIRKQLLKHIIDKQAESYKTFGGSDQMTIWWNYVLQDNKQLIYDYCIICYKNPTKNYKYYYDDQSCIEFIKFEQTDKFPKDSFHYNITNCVDHRGDLVCPINDCKCTLYFMFTFKDWLHIENTFKLSVPDFVKYWHNDRFGYPTFDNSILDIVDPVSKIKTPLNSYRSASDAHYVRAFKFDFIIGFSKSGFNKVLKG